jgi:hypothetical protein
MVFNYEVIISVILTLYLLFEIIRIHIFKKYNLQFFAGFVSVLLICFGVYLSIKYGVILEYENHADIIKSNARQRFPFAAMDIIAGLLFVSIAVMKWIVGEIKKLIDF